MTTLLRFLDNDRTGRCANIRMDNGDPCWIGITQSGVLVKTSKISLSRAKLFDESNVYRLAKTARSLNEKYEDDLTPQELWNPVLKALVNTILHCSSLAEVSRILNEVYAAQSESADE